MSTQKPVHEEPLTVMREGQGLIPKHHREKKELVHEQSKQQTIQMSTQLVDKSDVVYPYRGILLSNEKA
jgi:hypothetical protein